MPWESGAEFAKKHNKKLHGASATKAKQMAEAMIRSGTDEGTAIATANKYANKHRGKKKRGTVHHLMSG